MESLQTDILIFLIIAGFVAAFIDSVVGGGGLISVPALLLTGLPPGIALGTNKMASSMSSLTSTVSFLLSGKIHLKLSLVLFPLSFAASALGSYVVSHIPSDFLRPLVVVLLMLVTVYTLTRKAWGEQTTFAGLSKYAAVLIGLAAILIGFYDGFFGPGTGSFLIFAMLLLGFDFVKAAGNAKVLNFASNVGSLAMFMSLGAVHYAYGLTMGLAMIAGAAAGSQLAIRRGTMYVKPLFIGVTVLLIGKQIWDLL